MKTALLIVDIQNDYFPQGKMELEGSLAAASNAARVLEAFRDSALPVIHVQHLSINPGATFFLPGTEGSEIHETVSPAPGEAIVRKHFPNSFRDTDLHARLVEMGVKRLVICGMMTHMCIDATARAAFDHGFQCTLVGDACATTGLLHQGHSVSADSVHWAFLAALNAVYANVVSVDEFLASGLSTS